MVVGNRLMVDFLHPNPDPYVFTGREPCLVKLDNGRGVSIISEEVL